jgi:pimeloyl-ACP methyl ester carboxylesterase
VLGSEHDAKRAWKETSRMSIVTSADGTTIDYDAYGEGPAVVLVAGAVQHRAIDPRTTEAARLLAARGCTALDFDRRGRGRSQDTAPWALEREVEDVAALITAAGGSATLCASSSGAALGLQAALAGIGVSGLLLYEPPFFPGPAKASQVHQIQRFLERGDRDAAMRYNLLDVVGLPAPVVEGVTRSPAWAAMCGVAPTLVYDFSALDDVNTDPDWTARWAGLAVPVSVCSGADSPPALVSAADRVAAALPGAQRRVLPGQDHSPSAEALAGAVLQHLSGRPDPSG